jgi:lysophospholipase L1-like esterase
VKRIFGLILVAAGLLVGLMLGEVVLRFAWTNPWVHANRSIPLREQLPNRNASFVLDKTFFPHGSTTLRADADGFMLPGYVDGPKPTLTVAFLGGSTTESSLLPEDKRWPYVAAQKLSAQLKRGVRVINAGTSGANTHNLLNVLLNKVVKYSPDVIVMMEAINDAGVLAEKGSYDSAMVMESTPAFGDLLSRKIAVVGLARDVRARRIVNQEFNDFARQTAANWRNQTFYADDQRDQRLAAGAPQYAARLRLFVDMTKSLGAVPVLMTQAHVGERKATLTEAERNSWLGGLQYLDRFNGLVRDVAREKQIALVDLGATIEPKREYFYDNIHYSVAGAEQVADTVARYLATLVTARNP